MSRAGQKTGGGRGVTDDEARLWEQATRSVAPVKPKPRVSPAPAPSDPATPPRTNQPAAASGKVTPAPRQPVTPASKPRAPAPLADFDRRKARRIASGRIEVDDRIDLHGFLQRDARASLRAFLLASQAKGYKTVLVITGKGGGADPADAYGSLMGERQRGVLKRNVPLWLAEPDLRAVVVSYTQATPRHGGAGALYVQLRKARG
jgi:DNA-nicking Smr family endonuclease